MKIAVTGKGGVGKTTFAATLARLYADEGKKVLAADVDPDANLGLALGFDEETLDSIVPIGTPASLATWCNFLLAPPFTILRRNTMSSPFSLTQYSNYLRRKAFLVSS